MVYKCEYTVLCIMCVNSTNHCTKLHHISTGKMKSSWFKRCSGFVFEHNPCTCRKYVHHHVYVLQYTYSFRQAFYCLLLSQRFSDVYFVFCRISMSLCCTYRISTFQDFWFSFLVFNYSWPVLGSYVLDIRCRWSRGHFSMFWRLKTDMLIHVLISI